MVSIQVDVDHTTLWTKPHQAIQSFSLQLLKERQAMIEKIKGIEYSGGGEKGKVVDCYHSGVVVLTEGNKRVNVPLSMAKMNQLLAAATRRK